MRKIVITYGLIAAGISAIIWTGICLLMKYADAGHSMILGYTAMLISAFIIYFAIKNYRDNIGGGTIKFGKAFLIGLYISIIYTVLYAVTWMILRATIMTDFVESYIAYERKSLEQSGASAAVIQAKVQEMEKMMAMFSNPLLEALMVFTEPWPVAILVTLVSALILSRKKKQQDSLAESGGNIFKQ